jgi:peptidoglycan pentaglycine glycine transferase (the first glycine)
MVKTGSGTLAAMQCRQPGDARWDSFLAESHLGHFYQTSMWARTRMLDGWQPLIMVITLDDAIVGGFQVLTRTKSRIGKIGLVLKGPVVNSHDAPVIDFVMKTLKSTARTNRIKALIVQPPDRDQGMTDFLMKSDFSPSHLEHTIKNNTVVIDLRGDEESLFKAMKSKKRQNIRTATRSGVIVREGNREDLGTFFRFMLETCRRQHVSPSPSSEKFLEQMWDIFSPTGNIKLFVSEYNREVLSCLLVVPFGDTAYLWKFGWSGKHPKLFPNEIVYWEILKWAKTNGHCYADLGAIGKELANVMWDGQAITDERTKTYSYYKLSFGGEVVRLTEGFVYFYNPLLRRAYNFFMPRISAMPYLKSKILPSEP